MESKVKDTPGYPSAQVCVIENFGGVCWKLDLHVDSSVSRPRIMIAGSGRANESRSKMKLRTQRSRGEAKTGRQKQAWCGPPRIGAGVCGRLSGSFVFFSRWFCRRPGRTRGSGSCGVRRKGGQQECWEQRVSATMRSTGTTRAEPLSTKKKNTQVRRKRTVHALHAFARSYVCTCVTQ